MKFLSLKNKSITTLLLIICLTFFTAMGCGGSGDGDKGDSTVEDGGQDAGDKTDAGEKEDGGEGEVDGGDAEVDETPAPQPLKFTSFPITNGSVGQKYRYQVTLNNSGEYLFSIKKRPDGMTINENGLITWYPGKDSGESQEVTVKVMLGTEVVEQKFTIDIASFKKWKEEEVNPKNPNGKSVTVDAPMSPIKGSGVNIPAEAVRSQEKSIKVSVNQVNNAPNVPHMGVRGGVRGKEGKITQADLVPVEFGPAGTKFDSPVELFLPLPKNIDSSVKLEAKTFNLESGNWENADLEDVDYENNVAVVRSNHFSMYTVTPKPDIVSTKLFLGGDNCSQKMFAEFKLDVKPEEIETKYINVLTDGIKITEKNLKEIIQKMDDRVLSIKYQVYVLSKNSSSDNELYFSDMIGIGSLFAKISTFQDNLGENKKKIVLTAETELVNQVFNVKTDIEEITNLLFNDKFRIPIYMYRNWNDQTKSTPITVSYTIEISLLKTGKAENPLVGGLFRNTKLLAQTIATEEFSKLSIIDDDKDCDGIKNQDDKEDKKFVPPLFKAQLTEKVIVTEINKTVDLKIVVEHAEETLSKWSSSGGRIIAVAKPENKNQRANFSSTKPGTFQVKLAVKIKDDPNEYSHTFNIRVEKPVINTPPTCKIISMRPALKENDKLQLIAIGEDAEQLGNNLRFRWESNGDLSSDKGPNVSFSAADAGDYHVRCFAHDGKEEGKPSQIALTVVKEKENMAPKDFRVTPISLVVEKEDPTAEASVNIVTRAMDPEGEKVTFNFNLLTRKDASLTKVGEDLPYRAVRKLTSKQLGSFILKVFGQDEQGAKTRVQFVKITIVPKIAKPVDNDGDGFPGGTGKGLDCDDNNIRINPGAKEICGDNIDQDCNGSDLGVEHCDGDGDSITPSEGDCDDADPSRFPGAREFCDGIDNNCNQEVDEGYSLGFPCMVGKGECHDEGELVCSSSKTTVACSASVKEKEAEICDGRDNDCDGQVDEEIATELCDLQDGVCQGAQKYCGGKLGYLVCGAGEYDADYEIEETSCDGKDNDCDGQVDENCLCQQNETRPCGIDTGECQKGTQSCSSGKWASCSGAKPPKAELCNGKDDDCDGEIDEDFAWLETACDGADTDMCKNGTYTCSSDGKKVVCENETKKDIKDICNNIDDDCDGQIDEDFPTLGKRCDSDDPDLCQAGTFQCDASGDKTICKESKTFAELCNRMDDDCDGAVDENFPKLNQSCDGLDSDRCKNGKFICTLDGSTTTCNEPTEGGIKEICDNKDNDCDGTVDEGLRNACGQCGATPAEVCDNQDNDCDGKTDEGLLNACGQCGATPIEICDGKDNDCDGATDEGLTAAAATKTRGLCAGKKLVCSGADGWKEPDYTAISGYETTETSCDNKDNDCNGQVDEGLKNGCGGCGEMQGQLEESCDGPDEDQCKHGTFVCKSDNSDVECSEIGASFGEICDGEDNNCDGQVDEGVLNECNGCGEMQGKPGDSCDSDDSDLCKKGTWTCKIDAVDVECVNESIKNIVEICDNQDNDCDGQVDENIQVACYMGPQDAMGVGACQSGVKVCQAGSFKECVGQVLPQPEECDGKDNDCDGAIDEECGIAQFAHCDGERKCEPSSYCFYSERFKTNHGWCFPICHGDTSCPPKFSCMVDKDGERCHPEDKDKDTFPFFVDCDENNPEINPGAKEVCKDQKDNNCNNKVDEICEDLDNDTFLGDVDCDDHNKEINPNATEICDNLDNNCDGAIDELASCQTVGKSCLKDSDCSFLIDGTARDALCSKPWYIDNRDESLIKGVCIVENQNCTEFTCPSESVCATTTEGNIQACLPKCKQHLCSEGFTCNYIFGGAYCDRRCKVNQECKIQTSLFTGQGTCHWDGRCSLPCKDAADTDLCQELESAFNSAGADINFKCELENTQTKDGYTKGGEFCRPMCKYNHQCSAGHVCVGGMCVPECHKPYEACEFYNMAGICHVAGKHSIYTEDQQTKLGEVGGNYCFQKCKINSECSDDNNRVCVQGMCAPKCPASPAKCSDQAQDTICWPHFIRDLYQDGNLIGEEGGSYCSYPCKINIDCGPGQVCLKDGLCAAGCTMVGVKCGFGDGNFVCTENPLEDVTDASSNLIGKRGGSYCHYQCISQRESCDGIDNDCDGKIDEGCGQLDPEAHIGKECADASQCQSLHGRLSLCVKSKPEDSMGVCNIPCQPGGFECSNLISADHMCTQVAGVNFCSTKCMNNHECRDHMVCQKDNNGRMVCLPGVKTDQDGDGYSPPLDCDDSNADLKPDNYDSCDGIDNDCDGKTDEDQGHIDCGEGECRVTVPECVDGKTNQCTPGEPTTETCDGRDNDCDGQVDEDAGCAPVIGKSCTSDSDCGMHLGTKSVQASCLESDGQKICILKNPGCPKEGCPSNTICLKDRILDEICLPNCDPTGCAIPGEFICQPNFEKDFFCWRKCQTNSDCQIYLADENKTINLVCSSSGQCFPPCDVSRGDNCPIGDSQNTGSFICIGKEIQDVLDSNNQVLGQRGGDHCIRRCLEDKDCGPNMFCNHKIKRCLGTPCNSDEECGSDYTCSNYKCVFFCANNEECRPGEICNTTDSRCHQKDCLNTLECPMGSFCDLTDKKCRPGVVEGCKDDGDCASDHFCDQYEHLCKPRYCKLESDCAEGFVCEDGSCHHTMPACKTDEDCGTGNNCQIAFGATEGECHPKPCEQDSDCGENARCQMDIKQCRFWCNTNDQCSPGEFCDHADNHCKKEMIPRCGKDTDCFLDHYCQIEAGNSQGECKVKACTTDTECRQGSKCNLDTKHCYPYCDLNNTCPETYFCNFEEQHCFKGCKADGDCPDAENGTSFCNMILHTCQPGKAQCYRNSDCAANNYCDLRDLTCKPLNCQVNADGTSDCPTGEMCDRVDYQCRPHQRCTTDADCGHMLYCDQANSTCTYKACSDTEKCSEGFVCDTTKNICQPTACQEDSQCLEHHFCAVDMGYCLPRSKRPCTEHQECQSWERCRIYTVDTTLIRLCVNAHCQADEDCGPGAVCNLDKNGCELTKCASSQDCDPGMFCDPQGRCLHQGPKQCSATSECNSWEECKKDENSLSDTNTYCLPKGCTTDSDCGADGAVCDQATKTCHSGTIQPGCKVDSDCTDDHFCDQADNQCKPKQQHTCTEDSQCPSTHGCDPNDNKCWPKCNVDNDCPAGLSCNPASKLCVWYCDPQSAIQCDTSTVCIPVEPKHSPTGGFCFKKCDPALTDPGCKAGVDNVGEICLSIGQAGTNVCVRKCTTNDQCPTDNVCDPGTGQCNPTGPPKCASSTECNSWEDCRTDEANPADTTTYCLPKGCTDDTICGTDALCMKENGAQTGHCNPKCQRNEDCPPDHTCDPNTSMCKPPEPVSCASDGDCATDHYCDQTDNQCKPKQPTCTENSQCPSTNYGCDLTDNKCWPKCDVPADCPAGLSCNPNTNLCVWYCDPNGSNQCDTNTVCIPVDTTYSPTGGYCLKKCDPAFTDPGCKMGSDNWGEACITLGQNAINVCVRRCKSDSECRPGVCDIATGKCGPAELPKCTDGTECNSWEECKKDENNLSDTNTYCLPKGCTTDSDCGADGAVCDETTKTCHSGTVQPACNVDSDCTADHFCDQADNQCKPKQTACTEDSQCPTDHFCDQADNQCKPKQTACTEDSQCYEGFVCEQTTKKCWPKCDVDTDCPAGPTCNPDTNICAWFCTPGQMNQCDANTLCVPVTTNISPTGGMCLKKCDPTNPTTCKTGIDRVTEVCQPWTTGEAFCKPPCKEDKDCDDGSNSLICNDATGLCEAGTGGF